jgi:hypothetical protein
LKIETGLVKGLYGVFEVIETERESFLVIETEGLNLFFSKWRRKEFFVF